MTSGRESSEDYLEAILVIRRERGWCRNVDIAERLGSRALGRKHDIERRRRQRTSRHHRRIPQL